MKDFNETKDYQKIVDENGFKVVLFFATWCGPCNMIKPILENLSTELKDVKFHKINIDEFRSVAVENGVKSIPTILLYKDSKEVDRYPSQDKKQNLMSKDALLNWFNTHR